MARLTKTQRGELRHIRNVNFTRNQVKGMQDRHPDKPVTVYGERGNCVRNESDKAKRPEKGSATFGKVLPPSEKKPADVKAYSNAFDDKLTALGWTRVEWAVWKQAQKDNPSLTLNEYRSNLAQV